MTDDSKVTTQKDLYIAELNISNWIWINADKVLEVEEDKQLPRISIITPSYNQGQFLEETIRSVLLQQYPNLEYIIIDGGSTDHSVDIIKKYEQWLTYWVSEPDAGQTDAIQKGFDRCTGVIWNWLNSDDILQPGALYKVAKAYQLEPEATIYPGGLIVIGDGEPYPYPECFQNLSELACVWEKWPVPQPAVFLNHKKCIEVGGLNRTLHYGMDYDLYLRLTQLNSFKTYPIPTPIACIRRHTESKTVSQQTKFKREILEIFDKFTSERYTSLPQNWQRSRDLFSFISDLDSLKNEYSIFEFIQISKKHFHYIWKYRYFWGLLRQKVANTVNNSTNHIFKK
jgi:glycosyltransferase involved in cell wall biosynthesis